MTQSNDAPIDINDLTPALQQLIAFEELGQPTIEALMAMYQSSADEISHAWQELPASAQKILADFEQFHALAAFCQCMVGITCVAEFNKAKLPDDMTDEQVQQYKTELMSDLTANAIKDLCKQMKQARRNPSLARELQEAFA
ncbi:DUF3069 domain-containing protein [uncultured Ferrimonas sp.]|uniref:DUF3069 domain-containing protein n=1 Tax=uncultured Ferrimonas sp. TaxID=432640 RepID=UPI00261029C6|nr:DUF3069 domain-containing protein [uncultured Ferrimonas sp.]